MLEGVSGLTVLTGLWMFIILFLLSLISINVEKTRDYIAIIQKDIDSIRDHQEYR